MVATGALIFATAAIIFLIGSAVWAEYRFRAFQKLPAHFSWSGKPTRFALRSFVIWLTPAIFAAIVVAMLVAIKSFPPEMINGDPNQAIYVMSSMIVGAQVFVLWLLGRWARGQS